MSADDVGGIDGLLARRVVRTCPTGYRCTWCKTLHGSRGALAEHLSSTQHLLAAVKRGKSLAGRPLVKSASTVRALSSVQAAALELAAQAGELRRVSGDLWCPPDEPLDAQGDPERYTGHTIVASLVIRGDLVNAGRDRVRPPRRSVAADPKPPQGDPTP